MGSQVYLNGNEIENPHEIHEHVSPPSLYMKVLGSLLVLTVLTVLVSEADLGAASLFVAMFVAVIKASLVVAFFMHLKYDHRYHLFIFLGSLVFVSIFFSFTLFDLGSRTALDDTMNTFSRWQDMENSGEPLQVGIEGTPEGKAKCDEIRSHGHGGGHGDGGHGDAKAGHGDAKAGHGDAKAGHPPAKAPHPPAKAGH